MVGNQKVTESEITKKDSPLLVGDQRLKEPEVTEQDSPLLLDSIPNEVISIMLTFLPIKEAGKLAVVNKNWLTCWHHIPSLHFDIKDFETEDLMFNAIFSIVNARPVCVTDFGVRAHLGSPNANMNNTIHLLGTRSDQALQRLSIDSRHQFYIVPSLEVFRGLTDLTLEYCGVESPFASFPSLKSLSLKHCKISKSILFNSLRANPRLKRVSLLYLIFDEAHRIFDEAVIPVSIQEFVNLVCRFEYLAVSMSVVKDFSWETIPEPPEENNLVELYMDVNLIGFNALSTFGSFLCPIPHVSSFDVLSTVGNFLCLFPQVSKLTLKCNNDIGVTKYVNGDDVVANNGNGDDQVDAQEMIFPSLLAINIYNFGTSALYTDAVHFLLQRSPILRNLKVYVKKRPLHEETIRFNFHGLVIKEGVQVSILDCFPNEGSTSGSSGAGSNKEDEVEGSTSGSGSNNEDEDEGSSSCSGSNNEDEDEGSSGSGSNTEAEDEE